MIRKHRIPAGLILAIFLISIPFHAFALDMGAAESTCPGAGWPWANQGLVVNIPAHLASDPVSQITGMAFAITLIPIDLVAAGVSGKPIQQDQQTGEIPKYSHIGLCGGMLLGKGVALAVGTPFWLLKETFWDLPRWAFEVKSAPSADKPAEQTP